MNRSLYFLFLVLALGLALGPGVSNASVDLTGPIAEEKVVFQEKDGVLAFEAEHFFRQTLTETRAWHRTAAGQLPAVHPDGDPPHLAGASAGAYLEVLPDTRRSHDDPLVKGENFSNEPGKLAILSYKVHLDHPGKFRVWARVFSTNTEDNGFHVGMNGAWPESGQRWQTVTKDRWHWESRQRTAEVHVGVPGRLWLEFERAGEHTIEIAMREDGIELDKIVLARDFAFTPRGLGPAVSLRSGTLPEVVPVVAGQDGEASRFPAHWGEPPRIQTRDYVTLPGGYGKGSSTLKNWIQKNLDRDAEAGAASGGGGERGVERERAPALAEPRSPDGDGTVHVSGELKPWHKVTLTLDGPFAHEDDRDPNPFTDRALVVRFMHESGTPDYRVPGYFAADGRAAETSAVSGTKWRAHLSPDKPGRWSYEVKFLAGPNVALEPAEDVGEELEKYASRGEFIVGANDKSGRDFRADGRLTYVGGHHLRFAGSGRYFLKAGADAPETFLAYADFDATEARKPDKVPLKSWEPHRRDWKEGDPVWQGEKGKGMIGALNYLSGKGANAFSFLPYNAGGDGDNVWPFNAYGAKFHYDCSKLDQWGMVLDHATALGLYAHFKLQETENDDSAPDKVVPAALDGGDLGPERKLYLRELIARFGHLLALNWNLGEENTQTPEQQRAMIDYIRATDPYDHHIVVHTYPDQQDRVYDPLLGDGSGLTGVSLQNSDVKDCHWQVVKWVRASAAAGKPWVVAVDEPGTAHHGMPPDPDYPGTPENFSDPSIDQTRKQALWGTLLAGGGGVEYYFGYRLPQNDLVCEDWRSRDRSWDYCRHALTFFQEEEIPFWEMSNTDELVGNPGHENSRYCYSKAGEVYVVYLPEGGVAELDLTGAGESGSFQVRWYDPRNGGGLQKGSVEEVQGGGTVSLGESPAKDGEDWVCVIR